jgi:excisionase family DNA binding protein
MTADDRPAKTKFLTTRQCAERLGVTINAVKTWIREEKLPALRTPGGHHRIAEPDLAAFQARLARSSRSPAARPRILIADDDPDLLDVLREAIAREMPEAEVATASDGYEALVEVGTFRPDVLVLDLRMPRVDGFEVCARLKARRDTAGIRIIAVTAYPEGHVKDQVMAAGADDFLEKPFAIERLRARIAALLGT